MVARLLIIVLVIVFAIKGVFNNRSDNTNLSSKKEAYKPQQTVISGIDISDERYEQESNIVNDFIDNINNGKISEAYDLLSNECKEKLYPSLERFKTYYCDKYFNVKRTYNLQSWVNKGNKVTYKMRISEDLMTTGEYNSDGIYEDYVTIVEENGNKKLNINGYIGKKEINRTTEQEEIKAEVICVDIFNDYEEYTLKVTNNTANAIMLDSMIKPYHTLLLEKSDGNYDRIDINKLKYLDMLLYSNEERTIILKFNKQYTGSSEPLNICFTNIVKNYYEFKNNQDTYQDYASIKVNVR